MGLLALNTFAGVAIGVGMLFAVVICAAIPAAVYRHCRSRRSAGEAIAFAAAAGVIVFAGLVAAGYGFYSAISDASLKVLILLGGGFILVCMLPEAIAMSIRDAEHDKRPSTRTRNIALVLTLAVMIACVGYSYYGSAPSPPQDTPQEAAEVTTPPPTSKPARKWRIPFFHRK